MNSLAAADGDDDFELVARGERGRAMLAAEGVGVPLDVLSDPETGQQAVIDLLQALIDLGWRLSDEVGRCYFAHAEPTDSMVSV